MTEGLKIVISAEIAEAKKKIKEAKEEVKNLGKDTKKTSEEFNKAMGAVGKASTVALAAVAAGVAAAGAALLGLVDSTKEYRNEQAKLVTAFESAGASAEQAKTTYNDLYRVLGDTGQATEAASHLAKLTTNEKELAEWTNICQGIYGTFGASLPIEGLTEAANETAKVGTVTGGLADALNWAGVSEDAFNESLAACNDESERQKLIRETLNGLYDDASKKYEENNAEILAANEAQLKLDEATAKLGETLAPVQTMLTELGAEVLAQIAPYIQDFAEKYLPDIKEALSGVGEKIGVVLTWLADNWELVSTIATVILATATALSVFSAVMAVVNAVMAASPITWIVLAIVAAIAALVAIIVVVIKHWDEIKAATKKCWDAIVNAVKVAIDWIVELFNKIIAWVKDNWQGLLLLLVNPFAGAFKLVYDNCEGFRVKIDEFIAKIKNAISVGFNWIKDKIITPIKDAFTSVKTTFSNIVSTIGEKLGAAKAKVKEIIDAIKGFFKFEWELPKLKVPKFSINPTGWKLGDLLEGVIPKLGITWNARGGVFEKPTVFSYGNSLQGIAEAGAEAVVPLENNTKWLDEIAKRLNSYGGAPIVLQVDGKTFAQISCDSINKLTKQSGQLPLVLA